MSETLSFHEYAQLFPMLPLEELDALADDIKANGLLEAITLYGGEVLDGRNRYVACKAASVTPRFEQYTGDDPLAFVLGKNLHRRHMNESQRALVASRLANMERGDNQHTTGSADWRNQISQTEAATMMNVSPRSIQRVNAVERDAPDLLPQIESGEMTATKAVQTMQRRAKLSQLEDIEAKEAKAIEGVYDVIVVDPPWPMEKIERDVAPNQVAFDYPTMTEEELETLPIPCATDCHVWLWTTHKFLPMALRLLDAWGLKYVCAFVWHKPGGFQPFGLPQYNCEFAIYARRGAPIFTETKALPVCFDAKRGRHSEKPEPFYDTVRRVTAGRRIDMFSRRQIDGFDAWGNEAKDGI